LGTESRIEAPEFYAKQDLVSYLGIPLIDKKEPLGTLGLYIREEHAFTEDEIQFLKTLAGQVAVAIHNSRLYEEIKFQAAELAKVNEVKSEFLNLMSHELRTPINVMMGYVELVQGGILGEIQPEQNEALKTSLHHSKNLLNMITDILEATRIQAQDVQLQKSTVSVERMLAELRSNYEASLTKNLVMTWDVPPALPLIESDGVKIKQILCNLVDNAIKFSDAGTVRISARHFSESERLELRVVDTGRGIAKDKIPLIFDLFRQLDGSTTRRYEGVGLGLYLAKKNAELLGAELRVESEIDKGSIFTLVLPIG
jgi:signal transduction histidine kinase